MLRRVFLQTLTLFLTFGCTSKKEIPDQGNSAVNPSVESGSMNFDAQGSDNGKIDGLNSIHFAYDKSILDKKDMDALTKNADWIKSHKSLKIQIEGHCDNRGSIEYNFALGQKRAQAAYDYLVNLGINPKQLSIISYGKERPLTNEDSEEAYAKNRRDNFVPLKGDQ